MGFFETRNLQRRGACPVYSPDHFQRRQFRVSASTLVIRAMAFGRGQSSRLVAGRAAGEVRHGLALRGDTAFHRVPADFRLVCVLLRSTGRHWLSVAWTVAVSLVGIVLWQRRTRAQCFRLCCDAPAFLSRDLVCAVRGDAGRCHGASSSISVLVLVFFAGRCFDAQPMKTSATSTLVRCRREGHRACANGIPFGRVRTRPRPKTRQRPMDAETRKAPPSKNNKPVSRN